MKVFHTATLVVLTLGAGGARASEAIRLKPGQCIFIGAQEVCAMRADEAAAAPATPPRPTLLASCKYGENADQGGMKGYTLVQIALKDDGGKTETVVKSFGSMPKDKGRM